MRIVHWAILGVAVVGLWAACSGGGDSASPEQKERVDLDVADVRSPEPPPPVTDGAFKKPPAPTSSIAAVVDPRDTQHVFVRTADVRCRVPDVVKTTYRVEDIVRRNGGYVTHTELRTNVERSERINVGPDTALERSWLTVHNALLIRVPDERLDSTLLALAPLVDQLDHRVVDAEDVKLKLVANALQQQRLARHTARLAGAMDQGNAKLKDRTSTENDLLAKEERKDEALVDRLALNDRIAFATVQLDLYQRETMVAALLPMAPPVKPYHPPFGAQVMEALGSGWTMLRGLVVVLITLWPLALAGLGAWLMWKRWRPRAAAA